MLGVSERNSKNDRSFKGIAPPFQNPLQRHPSSCFRIFLSLLYHFQPFLREDDFSLSCGFSTGNREGVHHVHLAVFIVLLTAHIRESYLKPHTNPPQGSWGTDCTAER